MFRSSCLCFLGQGPGLNSAQVIELIGLQALCTCTAFADDRKNNILPSVSLPVNHVREQLGCCKHVNVCLQFGVPLYGGTLTGEIVYMENNKLGCNVFERPLVQAALPVFLLVDRGGAPLPHPSSLSDAVLHGDLLMCTVLSNGHALSTADVLTACVCYA